MILLLFIIIVVLWILKFRHKRKRMYELVSRIPQLSGGLPILGLAHRFIGNKEIVTDPKDLEKVIKSCLDNDDLHRFQRNIMGFGSLFAPELGKCKKPTFMDLLIKLSGDENGYTNIEVREELMTIMLAASDTSAVAICNTLMLLRKYPNVQQKVYDELESVLKSNRHLAKEDLPKLKYLDRVIKESLRLYPPAPFIVRKVTSETTLPSGYTLPTGSGVVVSIWGVHRDTKYWGPDADCFDPDRFLPERYNLLDPGCYLPFSSGPRNCVGYQFALMSMKISLSTILRTYKIVGPIEKGSIPHMRREIDILLKAVDGYQMGLEKRNKQ